MNKTHTPLNHDEFVGQTRFAGLDFLRCVAVLFVVWEHSVGPELGIEVGKCGVSLFFAISGFLITSLLARERQKTGGINVQKFMMRRVLRIFPLYYATLLFYIIIVAAIEPQGPDRGRFFGNLPYFFTYTSNWFAVGGDDSARVIFAFSWSLSTEEQYYLVWPILIVALGLVRSSIAAVILAVAALFLNAQGAGIWGDGPLYYRMAASVSPEICLSSALAICMSSRVGYAAIAPLLCRGWCGIIALAVLLVHVYMQWHPGVLMAVASIALVGHFASNPAGRLSRFAGWRPFVAVGSVSYGIYLFNMLAVNLVGKFAEYSGVEMLVRTDGDLGSAMTRFLLVAGVAVGMAAVSFRYFERPFLLVKNRYAVSQ